MDMNVKQNIGIVNAMIRITVGFTVLTWITAKLVKKPWRDSYLIMAMLAAMKIAEGIVRFCPITELFERSQEMNGENKYSNHHESQNSTRQDSKKGDLPDIENIDDLEGLQQILGNPS